MSDGEDSCFICKEPGMLITCDGHSCRKVRTRATSPSWSLPPSLN